MLMYAFSSIKYLIKVMAGDSRVSPVSFLKANPNTASFLCVMVLKSVFTIRIWKREIYQKLKQIIYKELRFSAKAVAGKDSYLIFIEGDDLQLFSE